MTKKIIISKALGLLTRGIQLKVISVFQSLYSEYSFLISSISMKREKDMTLKDELPTSVGTQDATGEEWKKKKKKPPERMKRLSQSENNTPLCM